MKRKRKFVPSVKQLNSDREGSEMAKWADESRNEAKKVVEREDAEITRYNGTVEAWEGTIINGSSAVEPPDLPDFMLKPRTPVALVATGVTRGRGEAYGWRRFALLLGAPINPYDDTHDIWKYAKKRFNEANFSLEGLENWSAREVAEWHNWLPDPRKPRI